VWVNQFLLGRPGYEFSFDVNPEQFTPTWGRVSSKNYNLAGDLKERVIRSMRPNVKLKSKWFPKTQLDLLTSLLAVTDTQLSFITRNDWSTLFEPDIAPNTATVQIQNSSITKLSAIYAAGGYGTTPTQGTITITGVWAALQNTAGVISGAGLDYYNTGGGTYNDATRTITLGTALPQAQQVYVSYSYPGWLVNMTQIDTPISGGLVDLFGYEFSLEGI
jgi:hypothetical protein